MKGKAEEIAGVLMQCRRVILASHVRPDGDGLGCMRALQLTLEQTGKTVHILCPGGIAPKYAFLFDCQSDVLFNQKEDLSRRRELIAAADTLVVLDCSSKVQLGSDLELLDPFEGGRIMIDHHPPPNSLWWDRPARPRRDIFWLDPTAGATGVMVAELIDAMGADVTPEITEALFVAIGTDTGWFAFPGTDARVLDRVARLTRTGASPHDLYRRLYQSDSAARFRLLAESLTQMELLARGRLAVQTITPQMLARTGAIPTDLENIVNEPMAMQDVIVSVLFSEREDEKGKIRVNFRSKPPVDVSAIAQQFDGGGHKRAAGASIETDLDTAKHRVLAAIHLDANRTGGPSA